jgi:hypothetical protein
MLDTDHPRSRFIRLVTRIRYEKGLPAIDLPPESGDEMSFQLCVDDVWFDIVHDDAPGSLTPDGVSVRAVVCALPSEGHGERLCVQALRSNRYLARAAAGCLAVDPESAELVYVFRQSLAAVEGWSFLEALAQVAVAVREWRDLFARPAN